MTYVDFELFWYLEIMGSKIEASLIRTNIKKMLLVVMGINKYVLIISLLSVLTHI